SGEDFASGSRFYMTSDRRLNRLRGISRVRQAQVRPNLNFAIRSLTDRTVNGGAHIGVAKARNALMNTGKVSRETGRVLCLDFPPAWTQKPRKSVARVFHAGEYFELGR